MVLGAAAGVPRHDRIFHSELDTTDAIILIVKSGRGGDEAATKQLFSDVKRKFVGEKGHDGAARMAFLVASHWEVIKDDEERKNIRDSMGKLLSSLPDNYPSYHTHGRERTYYYQLRTLDALCAASGVNPTAVGIIRKEDAREYVGTMQTYYEDLKKVTKSPLPISFTAKTFDEITKEQHEAMLEFSGLAELAHDLQEFLATDRYTAQLALASSEIALSLQWLDDVCHQELNKLGIHGRTLNELHDEQIRHRNSYIEMWDEQIRSQLESMYDTWEAALNDYRDNTVQFRIQFQRAYDEVTYQIGQAIMQGKFKHLTQSAAANQNEPTLLEEPRLLVDINGFNNEIRKYFLFLMEREVNYIAPSLSSAFVQLLQKRASQGIPYIRQIACGETGNDITNQEKAYENIIIEIKEKAVYICKYIIKAELLDANKYKLSGESEEVKKITVFSYQNVAEVDFSVLYQYMVEASNKIMEKFVQDTEDRIIRVFEHDLRQLCYRHDQNTNKNQPYVQKDGTFTNLIKSLRVALQKYLHKSDSILRLALEKQHMQDHDETIDRWLARIQRIKEIESNG